MKKIEIPKAIMCILYISDINRQLDLHPQTGVYMQAHTSNIAVNRPTTRHSSIYYYSSSKSLSSASSLSSQSLLFKTSWKQETKSSSSSKLVYFSLISEQTGQLLEVKWFSFSLSPHWHIQCVLAIFLSLDQLPANDSIPYLDLYHFLTLEVKFLFMYSFLP